jgi:hypothetical protein
MKGCCSDIILAQNFLEKNLLKIPQSCVPGIGQHLKFYSE